MLEPGDCSHKGNSPATCHLLSEGIANSTLQSSKSRGSRTVTIWRRSGIALRARHSCKGRLARVIEVGIAILQQLPGGPWPESIKSQHRDPVQAFHGACPGRRGTTAYTSTPRLANSAPIVRVARPKPPYFPQAKISTLIKQIRIRTSRRRRSRGIDGDGSDRLTPVTRRLQASPMGAAAWAEASHRKVEPGVAPHPIMSGRPSIRVWLRITSP